MEFGSETLLPKRFRCCVCRGTIVAWTVERSDKKRVLFCAGCGMGSIEHPPADTSIFYGDGYYQHLGSGDVGYVDYEFTAEHGLSWAAAVVQLLKPGGRILDVGCADGTLLTKLPSTFTCFGIEVNARMAAAATAAGVDMIGSDLLDPLITRAWRGAFDVVTAIAVFEHLGDVRRGVAAALELLKPDGLLLFEVPYISTRHDNRVWFESSLEHIFYPSGDCLHRLAAELGAWLIGSEVPVRGYASNFIGILTHDKEHVARLTPLFAALTSSRSILPAGPERRAWQHTMLVHAAHSNPGLLSGLADLICLNPNRPILQRVEQLWTNDLIRLDAAYADREVLVETSRREAERREAELASVRAELDTTRAIVEGLKAELREVFASTSWQITEPLRRLGSRRPRFVRLARQPLTAIRQRLVQRPAPTVRLSEYLQNDTDFPVPQDPNAATEANIPLPPLVFSEDTGLSEPPSTDDEMEDWPTDRPIVSVIVTAFNYGHFVAEAVDSVLAQTFTGLEVIVIEGGSTNPESRRLTLGLQRPRTRVIAQDGPRLVGANRNLGIALARGKYVCCLDADDLLEPTYIEKAVYLLESHDYDVISTSMRIFGDQTGFVDIIPSPTISDMLEANHVLTCAVFRRSLWRRAGGFRDVNPKITGHIHEDWMFWVRLAALGARIHNIRGEALFRYRRHGPSLSARGDAYPLAVQRSLIRAANADLLNPGTLNHLPQPEMRPLFRQAWRISGYRAVTESRWHPTLLLALPFTIVGGAERLLSRIISHLSDRGWRVILVTSIDPGRDNSDATRWFESATKEIFHLPRFLDCTVWPDFFLYLLLSRQVNVLWVVGSEFAYDLLPTVRQEFPRVAVADLLFNTVGHTSNNRKHAERISLNFVESEEVQRFLISCGEDKSRIAVIQSGVDIKAYQPGPRDLRVIGTIGANPEDLIIGYSGRWSAEKDPLIVIEIARLVPWDLPVRFVMTGAGPLRHEIQAKISATALPAGRFHLVGEVDDVIPWIRSFDAIVVPSQLDGRPMVVMEALALGVPVVGSRVGSLPELISDGIEGFICEPGDATGFANRITTLAGDLDLLARMKRAARARAERELDERAFLDAYEEQLSALAEVSQRFAVPESLL